MKDRGLKQIEAAVLLGIQATRRLQDAAG
jgi:hypothetical protein